MKKNVVLLIGLLWSAAAIGNVSMRLCEADSNTPFDSNMPIMVGTKLTIYADSNSAASMWLGGFDLIKPVTNPDPAIGVLAGRGWDVNAPDYRNSHFSSAGNRARIIDWENEDQHSFELFANGSNMAEGTWFVVDYNATNVGDCTIELVEYNGSEIVLLMSRTLHQVATRDFNNDGQVNFIDFAKLASYWLHTDCNELDDCEGTDLNPVPDGQINFLDVMYFADFWLGRFRQQEFDNNFQQSSSMMSFFDEQFSSIEQQMYDSMPPIYLTCDTNSPDPNQEVAVYVHTDTPLFCMGMGIYLVGDATITSAMSETDCNNFGWDNGWNSDPYIDPNGWVFFDGVRWKSDANGTIGYFKFRYHSGEVSAYIDQEISSAFSWDSTNTHNVPFSQETLLFYRDPNEP
jgi:hypothetical protein